MIFESHAHYDDEQFEADRDMLLQTLFQGKICNIINVGASLSSVEKAIALAERYEKMYASAGVHPCEVGELNEETYRQLEKQALHPKVVAIGEIGLDYYWEKDKKNQELQKYWFARQMELAKERRLPVVIHSRDAAEDTLKIMKQAKEKEISGVIHCFSYSPQIAEEFVKMGYWIGVGGVVTFQNGKKLKETVKRIPLTKILLETDAPYLSPEPYRGKRNDSGKLPIIAEKIAQIKGIAIEEVEEVTRKNAEELFFG